VLPEPRVYQSILQRPSIALAAFVRTNSNLQTIRADITGTVHAIDPALPVFGVRTMPELMSAALARRQFALEMISTFALSALLLAALGIYGVMTYLVTLRAPEFGVRLALGAEPGDIVTLVLGPGLVVTAAGVALGLGASLLTSRLLSGLVYGVAGADPISLVGVALLLALVTVAACVQPVRRATRVSPMEALRS
jgi:putative ABC transport system permease protein